MTQQTQKGFDHPFVNQNVLQFFGERARSWVRKALASCASSIVDCLAVEFDEDQDPAKACVHLLAAARDLSKLEGILLGVGCFPADVVYRLRVDIEAAAVLMAGGVPVPQAIELLQACASVDTFRAMASELEGGE
jgi:hypothetical protein